MKFYWRKILLLDYNLRGVVKGVLSSSNRIFQNDIAEVLTVKAIDNRDLVYSVLVVKSKYIKLSFIGSHFEVFIWTYGKRRIFVSFWLWTVWAPRQAKTGHFTVRPGDLRPGRRPVVASLPPAAHARAHAGRDGGRAAGRGGRRGSARRFSRPDRPAKGAEPGQ